MRETRSNPHDHILKLLVKAQKRIDREVDIILAGVDEGLTGDHWRVLNELSTAEGKSMGHLHKATAINDSTLTKVVDKLVAQGLVFRRSDDYDRRKVLTCLSKKGATLVAKLGRSIHKRQEEYFPAMSKTEYKRVTSLLANIAQ